MKISILGFSGFIGTNLVQKISKEYVIDKVSLRSDNWRDNIFDSEVIINLVGKAHDHKNKASYEDFYFANVELVKQIYNEFIKSNANLLIHISSIASVEEFESLQPLKEESSCNPISIYGKTKRQAEEWLLQQKLPNDKKLVILRPPMIHGEGDKGSLGLLYGLISKRIPYPLASFDNQRSFISIDNFIFFINQIVRNYEKLDRGIYHISDDEVISTNQIIEIIEKVENVKTIKLNLPRTIVRGIAKVGDALSLPLNTVRLKKMTGTLTVSNQKIKSVLGIEKLPLSAKEGLEKTIRSFKNK